MFEAEERKGHRSIPRVEMADDFPDLRLSKLTANSRQKEFCKITTTKASKPQEKYFAFKEVQ